MNKLFKYTAISLLGMATMMSCEGDKDYTLGELKGPSDIQIVAIVAGQDENNPEGDGTGDVTFRVSAKDAIAYSIDFDESDGITMIPMQGGMINKKYTKLGTETYTVNVVAYGAGGTSSNAKSEVAVKFVYQVDPQIATDLTNNDSKTWAIDPKVPGHYGVGPWDFDDYNNPSWWAAGVDEKVGVADCMYATTFTFGYDEASNSYTLVVHTPEGAFTKTGAQAAIPGIPDSGDEGCYDYADATSTFSFIPSGTILDESVSTKTAIVPDGLTTYVGSGAMIREYEILEITPDKLYIRAHGQGEPWLAWYAILTPVQ